MGKSVLIKIEERIASVQNAILRFEGELEALQFTRKSLLEEQSSATESEQNTPALKIQS